MTPEDYDKLIEGYDKLIRQLDFVIPVLIGVPVVGSIIVLAAWAGVGIVELLK